MAFLFLVVVSLSLVGWRCVLYIFVLLLVANMMLNIWHFEIMFCGLVGFGLLKFVFFFGLFLGLCGLLTFKAFESTLGSGLSQVRYSLRGLVMKWTREPPQFGCSLGWFHAHKTRSLQRRPRVNPSHSSSAIVLGNFWTCFDVGI